MQELTADLFKALWSAAETAGPFSTVCVMFMWWICRQDFKYERDERVKLQAERDALLERVLVGLTSASSSVSAATSTVDALRASIAVVIDTVSRSRR